MGRADGRTGCTGRRVIPAATTSKDESHNGAITRLDGRRKVGSFEFERANGEPKKFFQNLIRNDEYLLVTETTNLRGSGRHVVEGDATFGPGIGVGIKNMVGRLRVGVVTLVGGESEVGLAPALRQVGVNQVLFTRQVSICR